ncbi:hypothetical protein [Hazenella coriacea]|uniref:Uncharacterized protein n=1 Tax=Hazenella coriacea TaxID=1179467 RepID=A0A4R3L9G5_9BACL|nr:hypothetical protein [Hazenella coriacea]TCS95745.1 hypothetical protein EDD58_102325 [Hazenella coriacea]
MDEQKQIDLNIKEEQLRREKIQSEIEQLDLEKIKLERKQLHLKELNFQKQVELEKEEFAHTVLMNEKQFQLDQAKLTYQGILTALGVFGFIVTLMLI